MKKLLLSFILICFLAIPASAINPAFLQMVAGGGGVSCDDDFTGANGSAPDAVKWTEDDAATILDIQANALQFSVDAIPLRASNITSNWHFPANTNWEFRVAFSHTTLEQPDAGIMFAPQVMVRSGDGLIESYVVRHYSNAGPTRYFSDGSPTSGWDDSTPNGDASGVIKIAMTGCPGACVLKGYVWDTDDFKWDGNVAGRTFGEDYTDEDIYVRIFWNKPATTVSAENTTAIDDFAINEGNCEY